MHLVEPPPHSPLIEGSDRRATTHHIDMMAGANRALVAQNTGLRDELGACARDFDELATIIEKFVGVASAVEVRTMAARVRDRLALKAPDPIPQLAEIAQ